MGKEERKGRREEEEIQKRIKIIEEDMRMGAEGSYPLSIPLPSIFATPLPSIPTPSPLPLRPSILSTLFPPYLSPLNNLGVLYN